MYVTKRCGSWTLATTTGTAASRLVSFVRHVAYRAVTSRIWISKIFQVKCAGQIILRQDSGVGGTPVIIGREEDDCAYAIETLLQARR